LNRDQREPALFSWACLYFEIIFEQGLTSPRSIENTREALEAKVPKLIKAIGIDEVRRTIRRGFDHVSSKLKEETNVTQ
jgi:hypothetical protein